MLAEDITEIFLSRYFSRATLNPFYTFLNISIFHLVSKLFVIMYNILTLSLKAHPLLQAQAIIIWLELSG